MVARAFCPKRMTTMQPTASPRPSRSEIPRRTAGPTLTRPSSATRIGVPFRVAPTTTFPLSASDLRLAARPPPQPHPPAPDRRPVPGGAHHHILDVRERLEVAQPAHHVFTLGQLDHHGPDVRVGVLNRGHDRGDWNAIAEQPGRVQIHLILLLEPA